MLSGMNTMGQLADNLRDFPPLTENECQALEKAAEIIRSVTAVPCTGCNYCAPNCPRGIPIPELFSLYNDFARNPSEGWKMQNVYDTLVQNRSRASDCIGCKSCERNCPQKLSIAAYLQDVVRGFES